MLNILITLDPRFISCPRFYANVTGLSMTVAGCRKKISILAAGEHLVRRGRDASTSHAQLQVLGSHSRECDVADLWSCRVKRQNDTSAYNAIRRLAA